MFVHIVSVRFHLSTMCLLLCTLVFSLSFCACFCSLFCQSVLWAMLPESSTWMNEWTKSKIQLIHITVIKYNTLRSNTHSKIHKNVNTAQNVITHTLHQNTTHSDHCRTTDSDRMHIQRFVKMLILHKMS